MKQRKFAVFDIDGTLIRWQLYHAVVDRLASKELLGDNAKQKLHLARMHWKRREYQEAFKDYENELIKIYEAALPNLHVKEFKTAVDEIFNEYKNQIYTYTKNLVSTLKNKGHLIIAISGSHQELLAQMAKEYKFDIYHGTKYEVKNGMFTGNKTVGSHNKANTLNRIVKENDLTFNDSYAIGDSYSDAQMLELVENPIAFNPDDELYNIAITNKWPIVLERKNVIYKLENVNGNYQLA